MTLHLLALRLSKISRALRSAQLAHALVKCGVAMGAEHRALLTCWRFACVIDIGANRGQFALAVRHWMPEARLIAFEPLPQAASVFRQVFAGDAQVVLHQVAIGPAREQRAMHVSASEDSSSLLAISALQSQVFPGTQSVGQQAVAVAPLADFVGPDDLVGPALLKLDVQGFEYEALQACEPLLGQVEAVYCECSFVALYEGQRLVHDVMHWLFARGFVLQGLYNPCYDGLGRSVQADFLFVRLQPRAAAAGL